jgi:hypothetical protein
MPISFPVTLDDLTNPTPADNLNTPAVLHSTQHANLNDAVEALEAKVGVDGSAVTTSLDYKVSQLQSSSHAAVTIGTASGLSLTGQALSLGLASAGAAGALSAADWSTFNGKQSALGFTPVDSASASWTDLTDGGETSLHTHAGGSALPVADTQTIVKGSADATKLLRFEVDGFTTGTTRVLTPPNADATIAGLQVANVFTVQQMVDSAADAIELRLQAHSSKATSFLTLENSSGSLLGGFDSLGRVISYGNPAVTSNFFTTGAGNNTVTGGLNVGVGNRALDSLTSGIRNFGLGEDALTALTEGADNVAIGQGSANSLTTANSNVAIGRTAMRFNQTGANNIIIGNLAGVGSTGNSYEQNIVIGSSAGNALTTGSRNVLIGNSAGSTLTNQSDQLYIANTNTSLPLIYGDFSIGVSYVQINSRTTTTNAVKEALRLQASVSTASTGGAAGFGSGLTWYAETATDGTYQLQGAINTAWVVATNASRTARMLLYAYDTAAREGIRIEASGTAPMIGLYGVNAVARATNAVAAAAFVANTSGIANDTATFGGYTIGQVVQALLNIGILT